MKSNNKLSHQQGNLSASEQQHAASQAQDFEAPDDLLRLDAAQTIVPPEVAQRLQKSLGDVSAKSWWQKLLGL